MMISGVKIKKLIVHKDKRGFFCEVIRASDAFFKGIKFAQLSHSLVYKGVIKAWHLHRKQTDFIYVVTGKIKLVLYDMRNKSKTRGQLMEMLMEDKGGRKVVKIPPGVAHGYKILAGQAHIIYLMNRKYDPKDELRIPHDDPKIGYNWKAV